MVAPFVKGGVYNMQCLKGLILLLLIQVIAADNEEVDQKRSAMSIVRTTTPMLVKFDKVEIAKVRLLRILPELDSFSQTAIMRVLSHLSYFDNLKAVQELKSPVTLRIKNLKREESIKYFLSEISRSLKSIKSEPRDQFRVDRNLFAQAHTAKCSKNTIYIH